jgi:hypothetical protein
MSGVDTSLSSTRDAPWSTSTSLQKTQNGSVQIQPCTGSVQGKVVLMSGRPPASQPVIAVRASMSCLERHAPTAMRLLSVACLGWSTTPASALTTGMWSPPLIMSVSAHLVCDVAVDTVSWCSKGWQLISQTCAFEHVACLPCSTRVTTMQRRR